MRWLSIVFLLLTLLLGLACSGSKSNGTPPSRTAQTAMPGTARSASGPPLRDCDYVARVQRASLQFATALGAATRTVSGLATADANTSAQVVRAYTALDAAAQGVLTALQALSLPAELQPVNAQLISIYTAAEQQIHAAEQAAGNGDLAHAAELARRADSDASDKLSQLQQAYPAVFTRLTACSTP